jgi:vacuolar iron transporter family protein
MAAGEYVSVSSQRDLERALHQREAALATSYPEVALTEVAVALQLRGIEPGLARRVAQQMSSAEPIRANVLVKYGISEATRARPLQAALASAASFAAGAIVPLLGIILGTSVTRVALALVLALLALGVSGALAAEAGGASRGRGALRVFVGGSIAMAVSALIGRLVGAVV